MKQIVFRPLRRIKKTGKISVASYMSWYKVKCADKEKFNLIINEEYKAFAKDELVYNHNGENLFWRNYNPELDIKLLNRLELVDGEEPPYPKMWKTDYMISAKGLDVCGTPTFSHGTQDQITSCNMYHYKLEEVGEVLNPMAEYELLTVGVVVYWLGWFLYQLENSSLKIGK